MSAAWGLQLPAFLLALNWAFPCELGHFPVCWKDAEVLCFCPYSQQHSRMSPSHLMRGWSGCDSQHESWKSSERFKTMAWRLLHNTWWDGERGRAVPSAVQCWSPWAERSHITHPTQITLSLSPSHTHAYTHTCIYTHMHAHTRIYTHTYTHCLPPQSDAGFSLREQLMLQVWAQAFHWHNILLA